MAGEELRQGPGFPVGIVSADPASCRIRSAREHQAEPTLPLTSMRRSAGPSAHGPAEADGDAHDYLHGLPAGVRCGGWWIVTVCPPLSLASVMGPPVRQLLPPPRVSRPGTEPVAFWDAGDAFARVCRVPNESRTPCRIWTCDARDLSPAALLRRD